MAPPIISTLVQRFERNRESYTLSTDEGKAVIPRQIEATDRRIDELVYELYGLTAKEITI
jgi:hypothetical protein